MITTIIFDLSEVYLQGLAGVEHYLEPIINIKANEIKSGIRGPELIALFHGELSEEEYWLKIIEKNNWKVDVNTFKKAVRDNFKEIKGTREIIEQLNENGFKLGLLSVHTKEWIDHCLQKYDYHKLFHTTLYSFEVAASKPDKKVYHLILQRLGATPEECLFIDDNPKNLVPAQELGIATILFKNPEQLKKELTSLGIKIH
ncbi:MAG: HAD family phosphatase [Candidatus Micrarchaeota archaeon]